MIDIKEATKNKSIDNTMDRLEVERSVINTYYEANRCMISNPSLPLYIELSNSTNDKADVLAYHNFNGIFIRLSILDTCIDNILDRYITENADIHIEDTTLWELLIIGCIFTIIHEMTHDIQYINPEYLNTSMTYFTNIEYTADCSALSYLEQEGYDSRLIDYYYKMSANRHGIGPINRNLHVDLESYYIEIFKYGLQGFFTYESGNVYKISEWLCSYPNILVANLINGKDDVFDIKDNWEWLIPTEYLNNLMDSFERILYGTNKEKATLFTKVDDETNTFIIVLKTDSPDDILLLNGFKKDNASLYNQFSNFVQDIVN